MKVNAELKNLVLNEELITGSLLFSSSEKVPKGSYIKLFYRFTNEPIETSVRIDLHSFTTIQSYIINIPVVNSESKKLAIIVSFEVYSGSNLIRLEERRYDIVKVEQTSVEVCKVTNIESNCSKLTRRCYLKKIVFIIHTSEILNHYRSTLNNLPNNRVALLLTTDKQDVIDSAKVFDVDIYSLKEIKNHNFYFSVVVSNHYLASNGYSMQKIGGIHVRFCYSLGYKAWDTSEWNRNYNSIICWGPYHKESLSCYSQAKFVEVGYPRLDDISKINFETDKEVLLWLPTSGELCSIDRYIEKVSSLKKRYHIVIKPHPSCYEWNEAEIDLIRKHEFVLLTKFVNNADYVNSADLILADYGGSAFAAIHQNKKVILLNVEGAANNELIGDDSLDIEIRNYIPNIDSPEQLESIITSQETWTGYESILSKLQKRYFFKRDGNAGKRVANHLLAELLETEE